jgi:hypothetical protein
VTDHRLWIRDGSTWRCTKYPGWLIRDTGRKGRRDRYVIVHPDGTEDRDWHRGHMDKNPPGLNEAKWSAEVKAEYGNFLRRNKA